MPVLPQIPLQEFVIRGQTGMTERARLPAAFLACHCGFDEGEYRNLIIELNKEMPVLPQIPFQEFVIHGQTGMTERARLTAVFLARHCGFDKEEYRNLIIELNKRCRYCRKSRSKNLSYMGKPA